MKEKITQKEINSVFDFIAFSLLVIMVVIFIVLILFGRQEQSKKVEGEVKKTYPQCDNRNVAPWVGK